MSEYTHQQLDAITRERKKLKTFTLQANDEEDNKETEKLLVNLSVKDILSKVSKTINDIINDILTLKSGTNLLSELLTIFFGKGRLIYISIIVVFLALSVYFIDISS